MAHSYALMWALVTVTAAGAGAPPQAAEICVGDPVPRDVVVVDSKWVPTRCGGGPAMEANVLVVESYRDKPAGATMSVCISAPTPRGWATVSTSFHAVRCKADSRPGSIDHNIKVIRRLGIADDADEDPEDPGAARLTGIYSDMRRVEETGDVIGTEIYVLFSDDDGEGRYYALVQFAEGVPEAPQLVELEVRGSRLEFTAYLFGQRMRFEGRFTADGLEGTFDGPAGEVRLPRSRGFWR